MRFVVIVMASISFLQIAGSSCGKRPMDVPSEVQPYVSSFMARAEQHGVGIPGELTDGFRIEFTPLQAPTIGTCESLDYASGKVVLLDRKAWDFAPDALREALVYHELGHCLLCQDHREGTVNGIQMSLMGEWIVNPWVYTANQSYYVDELFSYGGCKE